MLGVPDDDEALAFGAAIVRDLSAGGPLSYADWTISSPKARGSSDG